MTTTPTPAAMPEPDGIGLVIAVQSQSIDVSATEVIVHCRAFNEESMRAYAAAAVAADRAARVPPELIAIANLLHTQDNRITDNPLFAVQQKRRIYGLDADYCENAEWVVDGETWHPEDGEDPPIAARRVGYIDKWEFVTGCFTEQGCKDYIAINGHNLHEPRIYAYGSFRNAEFIFLRKWLMSLAAAPSEGRTP